MKFRFQQLILHIVLQQQELRIDLIFVLLFQKQHFFISVSPLERDVFSI